ncbi:hypothetical protein RhiirA4_483681 [Rhizophagus irregularis]|uniref:Uncharacterized protein n=1 Tax=Rhizophagus irregularis TaxID=588596 RepID=A0A2I1HMY6_9GLOM|nr:hypothetical protein RhiirA4_483681 [Rhizophagus irregularis]
MNSQGNNSGNFYDITGIRMNDNDIVSGTSITSDQHIPNNTPSNSLPNNNNNQQPIFNDASNDNANTQNTFRLGSSTRNIIIQIHLSLMFISNNPCLATQQSMPSNGSTPQFNSQYNNPNPSQSNVFPPSNSLGAIIINSSQTNIYNNA